MATLQLRFSRPRLGVLSVDLRTSGHQFDDSANQYRLAGYGQVDLYGAHSFGERWQVYLMVQNLLNQPFEAGRALILTLGLRVRFWRVCGLYGECPPHPLEFVQSIHNIWLGVGLVL